MSTSTPSIPAQTVAGTEHPNVERVRAAFDAFARGDLDAVRDSATPDATWTNAGAGPLAGTFRGWPEVSGMFGRLFELTGGTFSMEVRSLLADDARAVAVYDGTSTVAGRTATHRFVLVDEMGPDGRATATTLLAYDQEAADRHMAGAA
jgi:ketosteroid isomerase-like protein